MSRRKRLLLVVATLVFLIVATLLGLYLALRHQPAFYRRAMAIDPAALEKGSDRMLKTLGALESAAVRPGRWHVVITADEINGWLAVDLRKNHPNALPPQVHDPRVAIEPNEITLACRLDRGSIESILSLTVQPYLSEPGVVALRIVRGRAGMLPVPLRDVLDGISKGAAEMRLQLKWAQVGSDPVAMISLPQDDDADRVVRIESLDVRKGEIHLSGRTKRRKR